MAEKTQAELIAMLDPGRDYGERSYEQVIEEIEEGKLAILEGVRLPVVRSTETNLTVKGSGAYPGTGNRADWMKKEFEAYALDDFREWYDALKKAGMSGDVRAMKIYFEQTLGRPKEISNSQLPELFEKLLADELLFASLKLVGVLSPVFE